MPTIQNMADAIQTGKSAREGEGTWREAESANESVGGVNDRTMVEVEKDDDERTRARACQLELPTYVQNELHIR